MKLALPVFQNRVSPRFDCAPQLLAVTLSNGAETARGWYSTPNWTRDERLNKLTQLGVDTVICGGIDRYSVDTMNANNITVYPWVTGNVDDIILCYQKGALVQGGMVDEGGCCRARWRFRHGWQ